MGGRPAGGSGSSARRTTGRVLRPVDRQSRATVQCVQPRREVVAGARAHIGHRAGRRGGGAHLVDDRRRQRRHVPGVEDVRAGRDHPGGVGRCRVTAARQQVHVPLARDVEAVTGDAP